MHLYISLTILGISGVVLAAFMAFGVPDKGVTFFTSAFAYVFSLILTYYITRKEVEKEAEDKIHVLKEEYNLKIRKLKKEHDTTTLEKTIREGTQTLIKNAVDYFKIENIKNEIMPSSAAIQNLQLDKYGQIIELLADFSLILPDYQENQEIVREEITHQIDIYQIDEKPFASFLERIMEKYLITVSKKIREKIDNNNGFQMKVCPRCSKKCHPNARFCKLCGANLAKKKGKDSPPSQEQLWIKKGLKFYRTGNFQESVRVLTVAINLNPKSGQAYYNRGIVLNKMDEQRKAREDLKRAAGFGHKKAEELLGLFRMMDTQEWKQ